MNTTTDYQRQKVYNWEITNSLYEVSMLPLFPDSINPVAVYSFTTVAQAQAFSDRVFADYGLAGVPIHYVPGRARGSAFGDRFIRIGDQFRWVRYVLHEVAHIILHAQNPARRQSLNGMENRHGPQFVQLLIELRVRYCGDTAAALQGSAIAHRLIVASSDRVTELLALKHQALANGDAATAKLVRRQIRAESKRQLREAAGSLAQAPTPVVRRPRAKHNVKCLECGKSWVTWPSSERCSKCFSTDLDWMN